MQGKRASVVGPFSFARARDCDGAHDARNVSWLVGHLPRQQLNPLLNEASNLRGREFAAVDVPIRAEHAIDCTVVCPDEHDARVLALHYDFPYGAKLYAAPVFALVVSAEEDNDQT